MVNDVNKHVLFLFIYFFHGNDTGDCSFQPEISVGELAKHLGKAWQVRREIKSGFGHRMK